MRDSAAVNWRTFVAARYLKGTATEGSLSAQTVIGVAGVCLGVAALLIVQAVMAGFTEKLKEQMLGATAHVLVAASRGHSEGDAAPDYGAIEATIRQVPGVTGVTPFFRKEAMIARGESVAAARLFGVDPKTVADATIFPHRMFRGSFGNLEGARAEGLVGSAAEAVSASKLPGIILGRDLAGSLDAEAGDEVRLICPLCGIGPLGPTASAKAFVIVGVFEVGNVEYDGQFAFILLSEAHKFFDVGGTSEEISGLQVRVGDIDEADGIAARISFELGDSPLWVSNWKQLLGPLFDALKLEKLALFIVLLIIVLVASFNIAGMEILFVREKIHDIAILKAMGASSKEITRVFLSKGAAVGVVGTLLGLALGLGLCWLQIEFNLIQIDASVYQMKYLPILVQPWDVVNVILAPTAITTLAAYLPARRAGRFSPTEALRSE